MQVHIGIDWSEKIYDVVFMNAKGVVIDHSSAGFQKLGERRRQLSLRTPECIANLETPHDLLTHYLWCHEYTQVYVSRRLR